MEDVAIATFVVVGLLSWCAEISFKWAEAWVCSILTIAAVLVTLAERQQSLAGANQLGEAFTKAICLADGLVLGMSASLLCLQASRRLLNRPVDFAAKLESVAGSFAIYSLIVGTSLCIVNFRALTLMQIFTYLFATATNIRFIRRFFRDIRKVR